MAIAIVVDACELDEPSIPKPGMKSLLHSPTKSTDAVPETTRPTYDQAVLERWELPCADHA
jgi:hypothetical protein